MPNTSTITTTPSLSTESAVDAGSRSLASRPTKLAALRPAPLDVLRPTPIDVLRPAPIEVQRPAPSRQPLRLYMGPVEALQQIELVEVSRNTQRTDRKVYRVDLFSREEQDRVPVYRNFGRSGVVAPLPPVRETKREPSATIQVTYDDILKVRHEAYALARASHVFEACAFCRHVIYLTTSSTLTPRWNSHWSKSNDEMGRMLTSYLTELLKVVSTAPCAEADAPCQGQKHIPRLLQSFLRSHERP